MSVHEAILVLLAAGFIYAALSLRERHSARNAFLVLCVLPVLFLAVEGVTELLTNDETYMIPDITDLKKLSFRQWSYGNYHTSIALIGNVVTLLRTFLGTNDLQAKMLAKSVHWFLGIACLVGIFWTISQAWIPKKLIAEYFLIYFYSALLLPTNILSLKVANYDMLAMLLGVWGITCCVVGCERVKQANLLQPRDIVKPDKRWRSLFSETFRPDGGFALFGVLLTTLAAQEKQIAGPLLNLAMVLSVLMRLRRRGRIDWWLPIQIGICVASIILVLFLTYGVVAIWHSPELPRFNLIVAWAALFSHFDFVMRALGLPEPHPIMEGSLALITIVLVPILMWRLRVATNKIEAAIRFSFPLMLLAAMAIGAVGFYKVQAYQHLLYPIPDGNYVPRPEINGEIVHFFSRTRFEHLTKKTGMAYTTFALTVPSAFVLVACTT